MKRVNIFYLIHKGLRASLYHTARILQQTDFTIPAESEKAIESVKEVVFLFEEHAAKEDKFILPALTAYEPSVVDAFEQEHETDHYLAEQLAARVARLESETNPAKRLEHGQEINKEFVNFLSFNLHHMAKEEELLNELLWRFYDDGALLAIQQEILRSIEPWVSAFFTKWVLRGISVPEIVFWLDRVRATAPELVYQTLYQQAQQELPKHKFQQVATALQAEMQAA